MGKMGNWYERSVVSKALTRRNRSLGSGQVYFKILDVCLSGITGEHSRRMLKMAVQQGRSE